jgi:hypothetical protein
MARRGRSWGQGRGLSRALANQSVRRHIVLMATYKIIPQPAERSFNIEITGANGTRQTVLGFATEADAETWIAADQALDAGWISTQWGGAC